MLGLSSGDLTASLGQSWLFGAKLQIKTYLGRGLVPFIEKHRLAEINVEITPLLSSLKYILSSKETLIWHLRASEPVLITTEGVYECLRICRI